MQMSYGRKKEYTDEKAFKFDSKTGTIKDYNELIGGFSVDIPPVIKGIAVTKIGDKAFFAKRITMVSIPRTVEEIESYAFANNLIEYIDFGSGVSVIGEYAFYKNRIKTMKLPTSIYSISSGAFESCLISGDLILPATLRIIGEYAFKNNLISNVEVRSNLELKGNGKVFQNNMIEKAVFTKLVKYIPSYMFYDCLLRAIEFSDTVTTIGDHAFANNRLKKVTLPEHLKKIEGYAFSSNSLCELSIPKSVDTLGNCIIWIQSLAIDNKNLSKCRLENNKIIISLSQIHPDIQTDNISDLIWAIRENSDEAILCKESNEIIIDLSNGKENYIKADTKDKFNVIFDYYIGNDRVKSNGCNMISLIFKIEEINGIEDL